MENLKKGYYSKSIVEQWFQISYVSLPFYDIMKLPLNKNLCDSALKMCTVLQYPQCNKI